MRYVIVYTLKEEALKFHEEITTKVCNKFGVKRAKLPGHVTLKAPFEINDIQPLVNLIETFTSKIKKAPIAIKGYGSFRKDVIFMNTVFSNQAQENYYKLFDLLITLKWLQWREKEGKEKIFHVTIVSKRIKEKFNEIWEYVNCFSCEFNIYFDNISIYVWENNTWVLYREFIIE